MFTVISLCGVMSRLLIPNIYLSFIYVFPLFGSLEPLRMDNAAYPFLAFSGIPSISFRFTSGNNVRRPAAFTHLLRLHLQDL